MVVAFPLVENVVCEQDACDVGRLLEWFPLRTLGHVEWTSCTTRRLAWSFARLYSTGALQRILRERSRAVV